MIRLGEVRGVIFFAFVGFDGWWCKINRDHEVKFGWANDILVCEDPCCAGSGLFGFYLLRPGCEQTRALYFCHTSICTTRGSTGLILGSIFFARVEDLELAV